MNQSRLETVIGAIVLAFAVGFLAMIFGRSGLAATSGSYQVNAEFSSAQGVDIGSDVRMAGVKIGNVSQMTLDADRFLALLSVNLRDEYQVPIDSEIKISTDGLLGGSFVEIVAGADAEMMQDGDYFEYVSDSVSLLSLFIDFATGQSR